MLGNMRIKKDKVNLDYSNTKDFFDKRANKFNDKNPYSVTMYQDNNPEIVIERNKKEIERLKPYLNLDGNSKLLDVACGIGRWADAISETIKEYCGIDFSSELIQIALKRNTKHNFSFIEGSITDIKDVLINNDKQNFNKILMAGILMYLNDDDLISVLKQVEWASSEKAIICIREPIALISRLTLKDFYSKELCDNYNAIYRTQKELLEIFDDTIISKGFKIKETGYLFNEDSLNNRKETTQYFFIFER